MALDVLEELKSQNIAFSLVTTYLAMWLSIHAQKTEEAVLLLNQMNPTDAKIIVDIFFSSASLDLPDQERDFGNISQLIQHSYHKQNFDFPEGENIPCDTLAHLGSVLTFYNTTNWARSRDLILESTSKE